MFTGSKDGPMKCFCRGCAKVRRYHKMLLLKIMVLCLCLSMFRVRDLAFPGMGRSCNLIARVFADSAVIDNANQAFFA
jgi:hypothetical protein